MQDRKQPDSSKQAAKGPKSAAQPDRTGAPPSDPGESGTGRGDQIPPGRAGDERGSDQRGSDKESRH
jgi:hypothetical protein